MTQPQEAAAKLRIPEVLTLKMTPQVFELVRGQIGKLPYDEIGGLCQNFEQQVQQQIHAFNAPSLPPEPTAPLKPVPLNRSARRAGVKKKGSNVTPLKAANPEPAANA